MSSNHFITNNKGENSLADVINRILPTKTKAFDALIGYFYFSGLTEIYNNLNEVKVRILVGLDMERELMNITTEIDFWDQGQRSNKLTIQKDYYESLVNLCNTNYFDTENQKKAFSIYYQKIKDGSLEIRKTKDPCHAKMYIFTLKDELSEDGTKLGTLITGSSNLTFSGLRRQDEINVRFDGNPEVEEGMQIFEYLWKKAIVIADKENIKPFEDNVISKIWIDKLVPPNLVFLRVLHEYFAIDSSKRIRTPHDITGGKFFNLKYQEDAVRLAMQTIDRHNGAIIADVVGLGKSIIAATIANNMNIRTIIITPPHLTKQWEDYRIQFNINAMVYSSGVIEKAYNEYKNLTQNKEKWLIIIDEAHNYRNEFTKDYSFLKQLCQDNKVLLLTATPFNNKPEDIFSMVKLFQIPGKSTLQTVSNLGVYFKQCISAYKHLRKSQKDKSISEDEIKRETARIAKQIRNIIQPLIIRRSRIDLEKIPDYKKDLKHQKIEFPEVDDPKLLDYPLGRLENLYANTLNLISPKDIVYEKDEIPNDTRSFKATRYKPIQYVKKECEELLKRDIENADIEYNLFQESQQNLSKFMRSLLVRRFESSQYAFKISVKNMKANCENILSWAEKRKAVPIFRKGNLPDIENWYNDNADVFPEFIEEFVSGEINKLQEKGLFEVKTDYLKESYFDDLKEDISILQQIENEWNNIDIDPKTEHFISFIKEKLNTDPNRKIIVFTEFADTANYLGKQLKHCKLPVFKYTSADATATNKETINSNFDAGYTKKQRNDYQILVATDAISEGYSLHRAGAIFNYDIPYNPTRVIQRVGRINRINKRMFDKLSIYNYFPSTLGEEETRGKEISTLKMAMIHALMGEDTKILTSEEELQSFFNEQYRELIKRDEEESWSTKYEIKLQQMRGTHEMKEALTIPLRTRIRRLTHKKKKGVLVFGKKGNDFVFKIGRTPTLIEPLTPEKALALFEPNIDDEIPYNTSDSFYSIYNSVENELFKKIEDPDIEKTKRDTIDKIRLIKDTGIIKDEEYLDGLIEALELEALEGYALRRINKLKETDFIKLHEIVSREYLNKILDESNRISNGKELLILSEEIESDIANTDLK